MPRRLRARAALACVLVAGAGSAGAEIITHLPGHERVVALTFDACEGPTRAILDEPIARYLIDEHLPFTVFMGGRFARDNADAVRALAAYDGVDIENHSYSHPQDMRRLADDDVRREVERAATEIRRTTGRTTRLFRFPAGRADDRTISIVEAMGYRVVHWRYPSGDPDPKLTAEAIEKDVLARLRPGDILIFHINGRGVHTLEVLRDLVPEIRRRGYGFVRLDQALGTR